MRALTAILALTASPMGCGDPLIGPTYLGTPLFQLGGPVIQGNPRVPASHGDLSARVFWLRAPEGAEEQWARLDGGLAEFSMTFFEPPPPEAMTFSSRFSLGIIVLYADRNEDQRFDPAQDQLLGASAQHVVVYAQETLDAEEPSFALLGRLEPGYHVFEHDRPSRCPFVTAAACSPEGGLARTTDTGDVPLTLWTRPEGVLVPAPALGESTSIWGMP